MILFVAYILFSSMGLILFKVGSDQLSVLFQSSLFSLSLPLSMIMGIISYMISFIMWLVIVNRTELSYIYPLSIGFINIAILLGSHYILHDSISTRNIIGSVVIILGVIIMKK